jgi:putative ABC transport system ATP-binding protein
MSDIDQNSNNKLFKKREVTAIHLRDIALTLANTAGKLNILRGISLDVQKGEAIGVIGPSGGGKSTMMMIIAGLEQASSGIVETAGINLTNLSEDKLAEFRRDNIGIVFQDFHLIPTMTALENVAIPLEFAGVTDANERARDRLNEVGLGHRLIHYPSQLSGGEQQRVALARAFASRPAILLADEPTGNLDGATSRAIMDLLFELHENSNTTMMLISHDPILAGRCDRVITLADGQVTEGHNP